MEENKQPEWHKETDKGVEITLSKPLNIDGAKVMTVTMREPTVADQMVQDTIKGGDAVKEVTMMANLCMLTVDQIKGLTLRDYKRLQVTFMGFTD